MTDLQRRIWIFLTFRGRRILESLVVTLCAGDEFVLSRVRMQHVVLKAEKQISELPFFFFFTFKIVLYVIEWAVPPLSWKFQRFTRMPLERRLEYLEEWEFSKFAAKRNLFKLVKALCICHIFSEPKLLESIGYGDAMRKRYERGAAR
jgi:hypothetical protein